MPTTVVKTIRASGGDYTTLSAWEAANQGDLVTADEIRVAECYNDWPSGLSDAVTLAGSTTDATRYMKITVAPGHRHNGTPHSGFWAKTTATWTPVVKFTDANCRAEYLDVENMATGGEGIDVGAGRAVFCIAHCNYSGFFNITSATLIGCLAYGQSGAAGAYNFVSWSSPRVYGCVAAASALGFGIGTSGTDKLLQNCISYGCTTGYSGTASSASATNASSGTDAPGSSPVNSITSAAFVNAAGNDFHLAAGSVLIGAGTNLYSVITADIDGNAWPSTGAWDIGFDRYVASGGGITIDAAVGVAQASGLPAGIIASTAITAQVGNAAGAGLPASLSTGGTIDASTGDAQATGQAAGISAATTIAATLGAAEASGLPASISQGVVIVAGVGAASAAGLPANIAQAITITTSAGNAAAAGITAAIEAAGGEIACLVGDAAARGLVAGIAAGVTVHASVGAALAVGLPSVMSTGDGAQTVLSAPRAVYSNIQTAARSNIQTARRPRS